MVLTTLEMLASSFFAIAVLHTFAASWFHKLASKYPEGSIRENLFHLLGEVEVVFGFWAGVFVLVSYAAVGSTEAVQYVESQNFTEPLFVFAIMSVAATRPLIGLTGQLILKLGRILPLQNATATFFAALVVGPLLGSFITEPAAMTVTALVLRRLFFDLGLSKRAMYVTLACLLVNISIGGVLTHFAAPPVLMVASKWQWDTPFMFTHFGWKATIAVVINAVFATCLLRRELSGKTLPQFQTSSSPAWLTIIHVLFLASIVANAHHPVLFIGLMLFFLGIAAITREYQDELKIRESLLVAFFLGGLVVFGGLQSWWLKPLIASLNEAMLFVGATALTAITDNAALTYLGSQVEGISEGFKYALVAGAVAGGGLTVIANAPNPVAFSVLQDKFGDDGISPLKLLAAAIVPTLIAMSAFWLLP